MAVRTTSLPVNQPFTANDQDRMWLRDKRWDLAFITFSAIFVPLPYLLYLFGYKVLGFDADVSRNAINGFVAVAIGGPHMMSTFLRTGLDENFKQRYPMLIRSSIIIPIVVVSLAFLNLTLLLTVFFFWASLHVLHQIIYIVELYNHKEYSHIRKQSAVNPKSRFIDYGVILTCIFPLAAYKISQGSFEIGVNDLTAVIPDLFEALWFFVLMSGLFAITLTLYVIKTVQEYRSGYINWPKTIFVVFTVIIAFTMPALDNLDTAFQGLNTWHSFQYLAITFYIIKVRQKYTDLTKNAPLVARFSKGEDSKGLYLLSALMLIGSAAIFLVVFALSHILTPGTVDKANIGNWRFDVAYYTSILSFLWIHYYHDHFLFTDFEVLDDAKYTS